MAAQGLKTLLQVQPHALALAGDSDTITDQVLTVPDLRVVVYLPPDPLSLLTAIHQASKLLNRAGPPVKMLILSSVTPAWLQGTLRNQMKNAFSLSETRIIPASLPCNRIAAGLRSLILSETRPADREGNDAGVSGLTGRELDILLDVLKGRSITVIARDCGKRPVTLYGQRLSGLKKMARSLPQYHRRRPRGEKMT